MHGKFCAGISSSCEWKKRQRLRAHMSFARRTGGSSARELMKWSPALATSWAVHPGRQATAATLLVLKMPDKVWSLFRHSADPAWRNLQRLCRGRAFGRPRQRSTGEPRQAQRSACAPVSPLTRPARYGWMETGPAKQHDRNADLTSGQNVQKSRTHARQSTTALARVPHPGSLIFSPRNRCIHVVFLGP